MKCILLPLLLVPLSMHAADRVKTAPGSEIFRDHPPARILSLQGESIPRGNPIDPQTGFVKELSAPALLLFPTRAADPKGTVLLFPGGGYAILEMIREGYNTCLFLNRCGYDAVLMEYPIKSKPDAGTREEAQAAALKACSLLRSHAKALGLHGGRFAIMGYSAGGHLAAGTAQHLPSGEQPDDLILIYPAYLEECQTDGRTPLVRPPARPGHLFCVFGAEDRKEWINGFRDYLKAWRATGGEASFHLLPGGHGFGLVESGEGRLTSWQNLLAEELKRTR